MKARPPIRKEPRFWMPYGCFLFNAWAESKGLPKARGFGLAALGNWRCETMGFAQAEQALALALRASHALERARPTEADDPPAEFVNFEMYVQQEAQHGKNRTRN